MAYLRLFRFGNLIIILLTELLIKYGVIDYFLSVNNLTYRMSNLVFLLIAISSILIAASANIHNDISDKDIDKIDKAYRPIPNGDISIKLASILQISFNIIGVIIAIIAAFIIDEPMVAIFQLLIIALLYFYSNSLKCSKIIGNIIIALIVALVPILIWLYTFFDSNAMDIMLNYNLRWMHISVFFFSGFAFMSTLIRELIKDRQDMHGDIKSNCNTWASGVSANTFRITVIIISLLLVELISVYQVYLPNLEVYRTMFIIPQSIIIFFIILKIFRAKESKDFKKLSVYIKLMTLSGLLIPIVLFFV